MANVRKRILELTPLPSASLDTTIVGVDGGTTYRIELDVLADAVTSRVNILDRDRLASLESVTSSFESKGRSVISSSAQITSFGFISSSTTIPAGTISSSAQITTLGFISSSTDITLLNSFTSSQSSLNTTFTNGISARLQTSSFNEYTASQSTSSLVNRLNAIESVSGSWITESETGSFLTNLSGAISSSTQISDLGFVTGSYTTINSFNSLTQSFNSISQSFNVISGSVGTVDFNGIVSGSSQLTSSYDTRYVISGSVGATPSGTISSSAQITAFGFVSGSYETTGRGIISSSANLVTTSSYNADSASFDSRINSIVTESGSNLTYFIEAYANVTYTLPGGFTNDPCRYSVVSATENVPSNWFNTSTYRFTPQKAGYWEIIASYDVYRNTEASMAIRKNGGIVASAGSFNAVAQDISKIIYLNGSTDYIDIVNTGGAALQRDQYQQRSWFQAKFVGVVSGSTDLLSANNSFTGTNVFSGSTTLRGAVAIGTSSGDEGGEINLAIASTNQTLTGSVNIDVYRNTLRLWEGGGTNRGVYIDLSKAPDGNTGELTWKASGLVNRGVDVTLGNLKARIAATGNVSLQLSTVSGTYSVYGSSVYSQGGAAGTTIDGSAPKAISTTPAYLNSGYNFGTAGGTDTWNIMDTSNSIAWRITMILGAGVNNNLVSIERLH